MKEQTSPSSLRRNNNIAWKGFETGQPYSRNSPARRSPVKKHAKVGDGLEVGGKLPVLSPEQQTHLQKELLPGRKESFVPSGITIAQIREMSRIEGQAQTEAARARTNAINRKRRAAPAPPAPITEEQRARGRLLRYIALYEDEYREDILEYMYKMQDATMPSRTAMEQQADIDMSMRSALLDFLIEVHAQYHLRPETFYLAVNILDRYCSRRVVHKKHYQLVGCTALWIAAKYEDCKEHIPSTADLRTYCRDVYDENNFVQMEGHILSTIDWELGHPTAEAWLRCMVNTLDKSGSQRAKDMAIRQGWVGMDELETHGVPIIMADVHTQAIARFLMEFMVTQDALIDVPPCVVAEAALILAKVINWQSRERKTESPAALHVARYLHDILSKGLGCVSQALYNKYKMPQFERASDCVTEYYLSIDRENCLNSMEAMPDLELIRKNAEEKAAVDAKVDAEILGKVQEEETQESEAGFSFADSGYGSVTASPAAGSPVKGARVAKSPSVRLPPTPSSAVSSPTRVEAVSSH
ncbi:hypothetical protein FRC17_002811 [Serendipita sp. 399]|nr:hypothetical protein FRC17_002811 [Serendipita sp. 399]